jgi:hypothetical protein
MFGLGLKGNLSCEKLLYSQFKLHYATLEEQDMNMANVLDICEAYALELSIKSLCLHPIFGPPFTPYPLF